MLERLKDYVQGLSKRVSQNEPKEKHVIIAVHGYGRRRKHELDNLANWGKKDGFEVIQFDLFDMDDEQDCDWMKWVNRAKEVVDRYVLNDYQIDLVGFSMGGVIAAYLAATCPIHRLVLIAPAFSYVNVENITSMITKSATSFLGTDKKEKKYKELPKSFFAAFGETVKSLKKYIAFVECPVLILHGDEDEVISLKSSMQAFEKIKHDRKRLLIFHGGHHRLLMDQKVNWEVYQNIKLFIQGAILPDYEVINAPDIMDQLELHEEDESK
ncbi:MAG: YqiA/YcfP family alpha/beta fold hydrolase [Erysipelotrichaceae bacterium]